MILIQPSELAKIVLILVLADYFAHSKDKPHNVRWIVQSFLTMALIAVWIAMQPNLSTTIVMVVLWFGLLWLSGLPTKYLLAFVIVGLIAVVVAFPLLEPYQQSRIINFVLPDEGARHGDTYNVDQAMITIGSGGWTGMGYGLGTQVQLRFLKVRHTDFIFSAIGEEFGFLGMLALLGLLVLVILRCLRAAQLASGSLWFVHRLWIHHPDPVPGSGQYRCELEYHSGHRLDTAVRQLWGQFAVVALTRYRPGRERDPASQTILKRLH